MAYVRNHGNQLAIVHGERDPETGKVQQRVLFTICSKPEALAALGRTDAHWQLGHIMEQRYPRIRFDWNKIRAGIEERMDALPDSYPYKAGEVLGRFREDLCAFTRQLGLADPQSTYSAAELISEHRHELEYLRDLIDWRLQVCEQEPNEYNGDNAFFWRHRLNARDYPPEIIELMAELHGKGDHDRLEALAQLFLDCYPDYAEGHNYLGRAAAERGEPEAALEHFERGVLEGRKLFPRRFPKKHYWVVHDTRPYMRGLHGVALTLAKLERYDEALAICERMERECGDDDAATGFRAHIFLCMGRWVDARAAAMSLCRLWPWYAWIVAFASLELRDRREALRWALHGALTRPRTGRMLLGLRSPRPEGTDQIIDHNAGVNAIHDLEPYLARIPRAAKKFFEAVLSAPTTELLAAELADATHRWRTTSPPERDEAYDRMMQLRSLEFASEFVETLAGELEG